MRSRRRDGSCRPKCRLRRGGRNMTCGERWGGRGTVPSSMRSRIPRLTSAVPGRRTRETIVRLMRGLALLGSVAACSRAVSEVSPQAGAKGAAVSQAGDDTMSLSLKLNALNDTDVPIGAFYVDGTWGSTVASRIGSGGGQMICCASVPGKWHPRLDCHVAVARRHAVQEGPGRDGEPGGFRREARAFLRRISMGAVFSE